MGGVFFGRRAQTNLSSFVRETSPRERQRRGPVAVLVALLPSVTVKPSVGFDVRTAQPSYTLSKNHGQPQQGRSPGFSHQRTLEGRDVKGKLFLRLASRGEMGTMVVTDPRCVHLLEPAKALPYRHRKKSLHPHRSCVFFLGWRTAGRRTGCLSVIRVLSPWGVLA